jgi:hypothetical protein
MSASMYYLASVGLERHPGRSSFFFADSSHYVKYCHYYVHVYLPWYMCTYVRTNGTISGTRVRTRVLEYHGTRVRTGTYVRTVHMYVRHGPMRKFLNIG